MDTIKLSAEQAQKLNKELGCSKELGCDVFPDAPVTVSGGEQAGGKAIELRFNETRSSYMLRIVSPESITQVEGCKTTPQGEKIDQFCESTSPAWDIPEEVRPKLAVLIDTIDSAKMVQTSARLYSSTEDLVARFWAILKPD